MRLAFGSSPAVNHFHKQWDSFLIAAGYGGCRNITLDTLCYSSKKGGEQIKSRKKKDIGCVFYATSVLMINITDSTSATHKRMLYLYRETYNLSTFQLNELTFNQINMFLAGTGWYQERDIGHYNIRIMQMRFKKKQQFSELMQ